MWSREYELNPASRRQHCDSNAIILSIQTRRMILSEQANFTQFRYRVTVPQYCGPIAGD